MLFFFVSGKWFTFDTRVIQNVKYVMNTFFPYTSHLNSTQNFFISTYSNTSTFLGKLSEAWRPSTAASFDFVIFFHIPGSNLFAFEKCISARNSNTCLLLFFRSCQLLIAARAAAGEAGWRDGNCREVNACPRLFGGNSRRPDSPLVLFRSLCALFYYLSFSVASQSVRRA